MYKVLIVDDHKSMYDSLKLALEESGDYSIIGYLENADLAVAYCYAAKPDLVFMDVCTQKGASGLEATKIIRESMPEIKIIVMSGFSELTYSSRAKEAGAHGFVYKNKSLKFFIEAANTVMSGQTIFSESGEIPVPEGQAPLTGREMEVLRLICKCMTAKEIAEELFISERTVKFHKTNMLAKTGFTKSIDLAYHMVSQGWINPNF